MPRSLVLPAYAVLVVVWSSTWVAIKFGLEGTPPLFGAGIRFVLAGVLLLAITVARRKPLATDAVLATTLGVLPFAVTYGLIYWAEQYVPSGLTAVLFGVMPLYVACLAGVLLPDEQVRPRLFAGLAVAMAGLALAFSESIDLGHAEHAVLGATAVLLSPIASAIGNVATRRRGRGLDAVVLNGWAMLGGGLLLLLASAPAERWSEAVWDAQAIGTIVYLAVLGSAVTFVLLTLLLNELGAITMSYLPLILPFGALLFGWALYDEALTLQAVGGAGLVAAGLLVAQSRRRPAAVPVGDAAAAPPRRPPSPAAPPGRARG